MRMRMRINKEKKTNFAVLVGWELTAWLGVAPLFLSELRILSWKVNVSSIMLARMAITVMVNASFAAQSDCHANLGIRNILPKCAGSFLAATV